MKIKKTTSYTNRAKSKPVKLVLDLATLNILCRYAIAGSSTIRTNHLLNLRKLITVLDPSTYENDGEKQKRIDFISKALEARLDYHLADRDMIMTHIKGGVTFEIDFIDLNNVDLNINELNWVNQLVSETLQYQFLYNKIDDLQDICTRFNTTDYAHRGDIVKEFESMVDGLKNDFRQSKVDDNSIDMTFSLREGQFETSVTDTYNLVTNPNRRLMCGMSGLNDMVGGGFESGRVYMFFGLAGIGKSLTLLNLLTQIKKYNRHYKTKDPTKTPCIVLLTMENTVVETITRLFSMSDPNGGQMEDYSIDEVLNILRNNGELYLNDDSPIDIVIKYKANKSVDTSYLYTLCEDLEDEGYEVIGLFQDHVKRIRSIYGSTDLRLELGDVVNEMKSFAAEKDIPVITVSHLNRDAAKIMEDGAAKGATADLTMKMGKSNVGESLLMIDNLDFGIIINLEFDQEGNRYLCYNLIKYRSKPGRTYIAQPFAYGSTIKLAEDIGSMPVFKESLHVKDHRMMSMMNKPVTSMVVNNIEDVMGDAYDASDNAFSNAVAVDLNKTMEDPPRREIICPIHFLDEVQPDMGKAEELRKKLDEMRKNS